MDGTAVTRERLTALGQAKNRICEFCLNLALNHAAQVFATIVPQTAPRPTDADALRKDYAFFFERFYYFLNSLEGDPMDI